MERKYYVAKKRKGESLQGPKRNYVPKVSKAVAKFRRRQDANVVKAHLYKDVTNLTSTAGSIIAAHFNFDPTADADNWSDYNTVYESFQVQSSHILIVPVTVAARQDYLAGCIDRNTSADPANAISVISRPGSRFWNVQDPKSHAMTYKILPEDKTTWVNVGTTFPGSFLLYGEGGTASVDHYAVFQTWEVLFRGQDT